MFSYPPKGPASVQRAFCPQLIMAFIFLPLKVKQCSWSTCIWEDFVVLVVIKCQNKKTASFDRRPTWGQTISRSYQVSAPSSRIYLLRLEFQVSFQYFYCYFHLQFIVVLCFASSMWSQWSRILRNGENHLYVCLVAFYHLPWRGWPECGGWWLRTWFLH